MAFGQFELDRAARDLRRQGRRIHLQEQQFLVLCLLLDRADAIVTREEFRQHLWPASVYVDFDHGLNNAIARLREHLGDRAASPRYIETVPRVGYRFICPIRRTVASGDVVEASANGDLPVQPVSTRRRWTQATILAVAVAAAIALLVAALQRQRAPEESAADTMRQPSIAVLPFVSISSDPEDEYFADGLSEELMSQLVRTPGLNVAGRTSAFYFKGKQESLAVIGETLHVGHLLEGSVRRAGDRVRVTAQLIDATTGHHLWSETFDRSFDEIFEIQDEIAVSVAAALQVRLLPAGDAQLHTYGIRNPAAYRLYLIGMAQRKGRGVRQDLHGARAAFEQAIALDPDFGAAYAGLASQYFHSAWASLADIEEAAVLGMAAVERALALDPNGSAALRASADFEMWKFRFLGDHAAFARSESLYRRAIEADSRNADLYFNNARAIVWSEPKRAQALFERASELDPAAHFAAVMAIYAMYLQGRHDAARQQLARVVAPSFDWRWAAALGSLEVLQGRLDEAVVLLRASRFIEQRILLWATYRALGDVEAASEVLQTIEGDELDQALRRAAELVLRDDYRGAFEHLDRQRDAFAVSRVLDAPTARLALIAGEHERARAILEERLPALAKGDVPIRAPEVLPALDLVLSWSATGRGEAATRLLNRVSEFLDSADAPRLSLFTIQRARAHALAGEAELARQALERAYAEAFRMRCALDLHPHPLLYVDCLDADPAFAVLREDGWFDDWLARISADNERQLQRLRVRISAR